MAQDSTEGRRAILCSCIYTYLYKSYSYLYKSYPYLYKRDPKSGRVAAGALKASWRAVAMFSVARL